MAAEKRTGRQAVDYSLDGHCAAGFIFRCAQPPA